MKKLLSLAIGLVSLAFTNPATANESFCFLEMNGETTNLTGLCAPSEDAIEQAIAIALDAESLEDRIEKTNAALS